MSWQNLIQQQAELTNTTAATDNQALLIPIPDYRIITVSGDEAASFLQNLLTNDVNALNTHQAQLSGLCNPKGRLLAIFQLIRREQDYLIVLPAELAGAIAQRLTMFKLRSKVDIAVSDSLVAVGIINPNNTLSDLPAEIMHGNQTEQGLLIKQASADNQERFLMICEQETTPLLSDWLSQDWQLTSQAIWQLLDIQAGIPTVYNDSKEQFTPQQVNLDLVGGVSFKKGCYPGQEVVARLHYLGSPSRRMFLGKLNGSDLPVANTAVVDDKGSTLGHVVQAQSDNDNGILCQLSMKLSGIENTALIDGVEVTNLTMLANEA